MNIIEEIKQVLESQYEANKALQKRTTINQEQIDLLNALTQVQGLEIDQLTKRVEDLEKKVGK